MSSRTSERVLRLLRDPALFVPAIKWRTWVPLQAYLYRRNIQSIRNQLDKVSRAELNRTRITRLASALRMPEADVASYDEEFVADSEFLDPYMRKLAQLEPTVIQSTTHIVDCRTLYCVVRAAKPHILVETGVNFGGTSAVLLRAIERNQVGRLFSIDLPEPGLPPPDHPDGQGCLVPAYLRHSWALIQGDSKVQLPALLADLGQIDMFLHDSLHTDPMMVWEYETAWPYLAEGGILASHDVLLTKAFSRFCRQRRSQAGDPAVVSNVGIIRKTGHA
jgi:hypothetical protein